MIENNKKIFIVAGLARSLINFRMHLLLDFKKHGLNVVAFAPDEDSFVREKLSKNGISFVRIRMNRTGLNPIKDILALINLYILLKKHKPDFILSYTLKPIIYSSLVAHFIGDSEIIPMITGLGFIFVGEGALSKCLKGAVQILFKFIFKHSKVVFFQNQDILNLFLDKRIIFKSKAVLINGSGVDLGHFFVKPLPQKPIFLMICRLLKDKGLLEYFAAAEKIKKKYSEVIFKLVGYIDSNPNSLKQREMDRVLGEGYVEFFGKIDDVRGEISDSSVYVLPSYCEGTPRSVLEAMSMGRPIITTDAPGCRETVVDGVNGFLVPIKNVEKLAEAMEKFILHPEIIPVMGKESRRIAEEKFDVHKVNAVILREMGLCT
ncbi:MAG: glycosyltransferase family 4 protein [Gammaproteobacteria bacterium]